MAQTKTQSGPPRQKKDVYGSSLHQSRGKGEIKINNRTFTDYFPLLSHQNVVMQPLTVTRN